MANNSLLYRARSLAIRIHMAKKDSNLVLSLIKRIEQLEKAVEQKHVIDGYTWSCSCGYSNKPIPRQNCAACGSPRN